MLVKRLAAYIPIYLQPFLRYKGKKGKAYLYSAFRETSTQGAHGTDHTGLPLQTTPYLPLPCERSPDGAT